VLVSIAFWLAPGCLITGKTSRSRVVPMIWHRVFYGWWIVIACLATALIGNALGLFGAGVYLSALTRAHGWPIGLVSGAATLFYVVSAVLLIPVGGAINRFGPRPVTALGGVAMACGVTGIGQVSAPWQAYLAFFAMGIGWACLSTTAVATTIAPWFEKYQGRAVSVASLGASAGGMIAAPSLLFGIGCAGFAVTTAVAGLFAALVVLPLALFVLRHRPEDLGLCPDGEPAAPTVKAAPRWTRMEALRTRSLRGVMLSFGLGMMVQIGFLTHQVTLLTQTLTNTRVSLTVSATAVAALLGRLALVRYADQVDARLTAAIMMILAAATLCVLALFPLPAVLIGASVVFGLTVGNVTTLQPIIVRREFGAASFGVVFGVASCGIQLVAALGPGFYGTLHDACGGYRVPLLVATALDVVAAFTIVSSRPSRGRAMVGG
jgi:MFS family permease